MSPPLQQRLGDRVARTAVVVAHAPIIQKRRPWWWLLVALGLYVLISVGSQAALVSFVDRGAAPGDVYIERAAAAHAKGDHAGATDLYERAIEAGIPQDRLANIHFLLGGEYYVLGDADKAIQAQENALEIDPTFYPSWLSLGTAYWAIGEAARAEECFLRLMELAPHLPEGPASLGWLYLERGDVEQAAGLMDQAIELDPSSGTAHAYRAVAHALQGRFEEAEASLRKARENGYREWEWIEEQIEIIEAEGHRP